MDEHADGVQPDQGQGAEANAGAPYAEYLARIPEDARNQVEPVFKDWDANVTRRFQDAAQYRQQWEPYEQAGIRDVPADELQGWLQFRQAAMQDPQAIAQWYDQYAQANGLTPQQQQQQSQQEQPYVDPDTETYLSRQFEQVLGPIQQQLQQFQQWQQAQEQQAAEQVELQRIEQQLEGLSKEPGFNRGLVEKFILNHIESDPENAVRLAWDDAKQLVATIEKQVLDSKLKQPQAAEAGGGAPPGDEPPRDLKTASIQAREMIRQMNTA